MRTKTCCVTGHRKIPCDKADYVRRELAREVNEALAEGYRFFISGFSEGVDLLFAEIVREQRERYPDIFLEAALPYMGRIMKLNESGRNLLKMCNGLKLVSEKYHKDCFFLRNRYMVQNSNRVIAVFDACVGSGTLYTMDCALAMGRELRIIEI